MEVLNQVMSKANVGCRPTTTFLKDFSVADTFGTDAIRSTYDRVFNEWKENYKYLTELVIILNRKIQEYRESREIYADIYGELFHKTREYATENLKGEELSCFILAKQLVG